MNMLKNTQNLRGSVMPVTIILCVLAAVSSIWMIRTMMDHQNQNHRRRDLARAYFAAESGVEMIKHWGNYPEDYDGGGNGGLFYRNMTTGAFPNLKAKLLIADPVNGFSIPEANLATLNSKYNYEVASVEELKLLPALGSDPVTCLFKVESTGVTPSGMRRTILAYITASPIQVEEVKLDAGLISLSTAAQLGNGRVHWGESWSKDDFNMLSKSQSMYLDKTDSDFDPFAKYRSEGKFLFGGTWKVHDASKPKKLGDVHSVETYSTVGDLGGDPPKTSGNFEAGFEQLIPTGVIEWPDFGSKYEAFKAMAQAHGRYYSTDASGNIYKDGVEDGDHLIDFNDEFGDADRANSPYDLVFIDTTDGNPPADDGGNLATVKNSGTGKGMKGVFYMNANYEQGGAGNPASLDNAEKPILNADGSVSYAETSIPKVYLDGVMYTAGTTRFQGNPVIYGSVVSQNGYLSGGTPDIYYNHKLKQGLEIPNGNVGSVFNVELQDNYGPSISKEDAPSLPSLSTVMH
ncbi:MAG: hypothetical protein ACLFUS_07095 [Candidatus Sumerlaeia bacterium]